MTDATSPFLSPELTALVTQSIAKRTDEIVRAADAGEPPVAVLLPDLADLINEGCYWRRAEKQIETLLSPHFEKMGRKEVPIKLLRVGACYRRIGLE